MNLTLNPPMTEARATQWQKTRSRGRKKYVGHTCFWLGAFMIIGMSIFDGFMDRESFNIYLSFGINLCVCLPVGLMLGFWNWYFEEQAYSKFLNNPSSLITDQSVLINR